MKDKLNTVQSSMRDRVSQNCAAEIAPFFCRCCNKNLGKTAVDLSVMLNENRCVFRA